MGLTRVRAELALRRGDAALARQMLQALLVEMTASAAAARDLPTALQLAAQAALATGRADEARAHAEACMQAALRLARVPEQSAHVGRAWMAMGEVQEHVGQRGEAATSWRRALPILQATLGAEHPEVLGLQARLVAQPR